MSIEEYLKKKYAPYGKTIPTYCIQYETLATYTETHEIKRNAAKLLNRERLGGTIPLDTFIEVVDQYLQEITVK